MLAYTKTVYILFASFFYICFVYLFIPFNPYLEQLEDTRLTTGLLKLIYLRSAGKNTYRNFSEKHYGANEDGFQHFVVIKQFSR